jgi:hypothetical protein
MDWENPLLTFALLVLFVYTTLKINAEYAFCCPIFVILFLFTKSLMDRKSGQFRKDWVENGNFNASVEKNLVKRQCPPMALLRVAVIGFRHLPSSIPDCSLPTPVPSAGMRDSPSKVVNTSYGSDEEGGKLGGSPDRVVTSSPRKETRIKARVGKPPYVQVTYVPMTAEDITGAIGERNQETVGSDEEKIEKERKQFKSESKIRTKKEKKEGADQSGKLRREFVVGCLSLGSANGPSVPSEGPLSSTGSSSGPTSSFSQLMASLSLTRSEGQSRDSLLQNTLDPWTRSKESIGFDPNIIDDEEGDFMTSTDIGEDVDLSLVYPILQPSTEITTKTIENDKSKKRKGPLSYLPWSQNEAVVRLEKNIFYVDLTPMLLFI